MCSAIGNINPAGSGDSLSSTSSVSKSTSNDTVVEDDHKKFTTEMEKKSESKDKKDTANEGEETTERVTNVGDRILEGLAVKGFDTEAISAAKTQGIDEISELGDKLLSKIRVLESEASGTTTARLEFNSKTLNGAVADISKNSAGEIHVSFRVNTESEATFLNQNQEHLQNYLKAQLNDPVTVTVSKSDSEQGSYGHGGEASSDQQQEQGDNPQEQ